MAINRRYAQADLRQGNPAAAIVETRDVNPDVASARAWRNANSWLTECQTQHEACARPHKPLLPTRVVDVQASPPRLFVGGGAMEQYAALSYCWGSEQPLKLTSDCLERYIQCLPINELPQTLLDAILTTRKIGLKYVWIDSLCIIQNDPKDKKSEISNMREIFKLASVTIVAANAANAHDGFLGLRETPPPIALKLPLLCPNDKLGTIMLTSDDAVSQSTYADDYISCNPIEYRAWTLEEKLLSQRLILYCSTNLRWLCKTKAAFDGGGLCFSRGPWTGLWDGRDPAEGQSWQMIIEDYSSRALTHPRDKLLAISGMAQEFVSDKTDQYLAGLWRSTLLRDLLWYPSHAPAKELSSKYRAPSWSWASLDVSVTWDTSSEHLEFENIKILSCHVGLASTEHPFGEVTEGELLVRGPLASFGRKTALVHGPVSENMHFDLEIAGHGDTEVYGLLFGKHKNGKRRGYSAGLILLQDKTGKRERTLFQRVGYFMFWDLETLSAFFDPVNDKIREVSII